MFAGQAEITGYLPEVYSIRELQEAQLNELVSTIRSEAEQFAQTQSDKVRVQVLLEAIGNADKTGELLTNENISDSRARMVAGYLEGRLPTENLTVKISHHSRGDEQNARKVVVTWKFQAIPPASPSTLKQGEERSAIAALLVALVAGLLSLALVVLVFFIKRKATTNTGKINTVKPEEKTEVLPAIGQNKVRYGVKVKIRSDGSYILPFRYDKDPSRFISKSARNHAKKEVVQCIRDSNRLEEINRLIKEGTITTIGPA